MGYIFRQYLFYKNANVSRGPNAPINFEPGSFGANWTWNVFENGSKPPLEFIANPDTSGINTFSKVAKFTALKTGQPFAGTDSIHGNTALGPFVLDKTNSKLKIMVWKSVIGDDGIKLASSSGWSQGEIKVQNTKINQREELTFDFSTFVNPPAELGKLDQIIVFPDFKANRAQDNVVCFDNITFSGTSSINDIENLNNKVTIYPNPSTEGNIVSAIGEFESFEIFNINGQSIMSGIENQLNNLIFQKGMYLIRFKHEDQSLTTKKFVVK